VAWIDICDVGDGNSVAIDMATVAGACCNVIDVFHEHARGAGQNTIIARSFTLCVFRNPDVADHTVHISGQAAASAARMRPPTRFVTD
jgi:hypothetical protein